ncbi:DUF47 family protein [Myxococcota bacterium]|nr:DUF47 family protein [Myxococcota bacterium]MBU1432874.1 DUF47 family protein [Myxococcota bacterium]MBU1898577.1 DUF47 family protein [Myxococcota bacterium]
MLTFGRARALEVQIDQFLDLIGKGAMVFKEGCRAYLSGDREEFERHLAAICDLEGRADIIRKDSEKILYRYSLIPESRGDVLGLLENLDNVIDSCKHTLNQFNVQKPNFPEEFNEGILELTNQSVESIISVVGASRGFFENTRSIQDHINKVDFHENEADHLSLKLQGRVFEMDLRLSHKMHLSFFIQRVERLSDLAEIVAERLAIASIKRTI